MKNFFSFIFCVLVSSTAFGQILNETFDTDGNFTKSNAFFSDGAGDYFGIFGIAPDFDLGGTTNPSSVPSYTNLTDNYLVGEDLDGDGNPSVITLTWSGLNILGYTNLSFSGLFAQGAANKVDQVQDQILVEVQIDGGGYQSILSFEGADFTSTTFNGNFREDTDFDGVGDGATLTSAAAAFVKSIAGTGSTLDLRLTVSVDSGDEEFGIDDIQINGTLSSAPNILLTSISGNTSETGTTATFDVTLNTQPATSVVINVSSGNTNENTVSPTTLTFTNGDWNIAKTVTVTGIDDATIDGDQTTTISLTVDDAASDDDYDGLSTSIDVINEDDECSITNVAVSSSNCNGDDATFVVTWTATNASGTYEVDIDGNGYQTIASGGTYTITGPTAAATGVTVTVRDANETTCFGTTTVDIPECPVVVPSILFTEIADPGDNANARFVEVTNRGGVDVDVTNWTIEVYVNGGSSPSGTYTFPNSTILGNSGGGWVVAYSSTAFQAAYGFLPHASYGSFNTNGDDAYVLKDNNGTIIDIYGVIGQDGTGQAWEYTDAIAQRNVGVTTPNSTWTSSEWTIASSNVADATPLPVELLYFTAQPNNQTILLTWATATEENNAYFDVQRALDGKNFETIGTITGAGTTYDVQEYSFIDENPANGLNYYRLQQVDFDGKFENHKVISVLVANEKNDVAIVPTQVRNQFDIIFNETIDANAPLEIYNINGQVVKSMTVNSGNNRQTIDVTALQAGMYIVRINANGTMITKRFVKL